MQNKENNQEGGPASVSVASPRVSSVGAPSEGADHPPQQPSPSPQAYQATVFSDHLHWGGVQRTLHARGGDARSVSSAAADRDAQSVYDDVGGLDAHTGEPPSACLALGAPAGPQRSWYYPTCRGR